MLILKTFVHLSFFIVSNFPLLFFLELFIELLFNQPFSFFISKNSLLLLLVMKKSIKFLDGSPFIIFVYFRVCFGKRRSLATGHRHAIVVVSQFRLVLILRSFWNFGSPRHSRARDRSGVKVQSSGTYTLWHWSLNSNARLLRFSIIKNSFLFLSNLTLLHNLWVKILQVILC